MRYLKTVVLGSLLLICFIVAGLVFLIWFTGFFILGFAWGFVGFTFAKLVYFCGTLWQSLRVLFLGFVAVLVTIKKK